MNQMNQAAILSEVTGSLAHCCAAKEIELYSRFNLSPTEGQLLLLISDRQPALPSTVAASMGVVRSRITPLVQALCEKGLLHRNEGAFDRRTRMLTLTDTGKLAARQAKELRLNFHARLLTKFPPAERERLLSMLELLRERMMDTRRELQAEQD